MNSTGNTCDIHTYSNKRIKSYTVYELSTSRERKSINKHSQGLNNFRIGNLNNPVDDYLRLRTDPKSWTRSS
jgi:hypothetical protein